MPPSDVKVYVVCLYILYISIYGYLLNWFQMKELGADQLVNEVAKM